jgi:hypothetical protein
LLYGTRGKDADFVKQLQISALQNKALDMIGPFIVDRYRETWIPGDPCMVKVFNYIYDKHIAVEARG